jgi:hypothetical protein
LSLETEYPDTPTGWAKRWSAEFAYAEEFHRKWRDAGTEVVSKFLDRDTKTNDPQAPGYNLNLFAANVTNMQAMLFSSIPKVSVDRTWADPQDQIARVGSEMASRMLNAAIEEAGEDCVTVLKSCLQDRLLPGLGCARVRYDIDEGSIENEDGEKAAGKKDEWLEDIYVPWKDLIWSPARYWKEIRWIGFRIWKDKEELKKFLGKDITKEELDRIPYNSKSPLEAKSARMSEVWSKAEIWEIWDKEHGFVFWWIKGWQKILKSCKDPLELAGFFPCPPFFIANVTTTEYIPKSDYSFAESLYKEVNLLEERIALLTKAIKVVGVYDKKAGDIARLVNETAENKLIPVDSWAAFSEKGGIKGCVDWLPLEQVVLAIEKLQAQQESRIAQLYQITGMADILRGDAPERSGVGTNQLKAKFASVRVQAVQEEFTRFATDLQKLRLEIIAKHFDEATIIKRSNMLNTADGQDPNLLMQAAQFLKDQESVKWRVTIAPESMAMIDYAQLRQERTEYINSLGIFLQSSAPIATQYPQAAPLLIELLKWGLAGFKGSRQIEGVIDRALAAMEQEAKQKAQSPPPPNPEMQKIQMEMQADQQSHQQKLQELGQKHSMEMQKLQVGFQAEMAELKLRLQEIQAKMTQRGHEAQMTVAENLSKPPPPLSLGNGTAPPTPTPSQPPAGQPGA